MNVYLELCDDLILSTLIFVCTETYENFVLHVTLSSVLFRIFSESHIIRISVVLDTLLENLPAIFRECFKAR